jgi:hypothetical protein
VKIEDTFSGVLKRKEQLLQEDEDIIFCSIVLLNAAN